MLTYALSLRHVCVALKIGVICRLRGRFFIYSSPELLKSVSNPVSTALTFAASNDPEILV